MNNERYNQIIDETYKNYNNNLITQKARSIGLSTTQSGLLKKEEFINKIKNDSEFSSKWGLKIEERELTTVREREKYDIYFDALIGEYPEHHETLDKRGAPRKIIIVTYNNETIEVYE